MEPKGQTLESVRTRIDAIDAELLRLLDARAAMAKEVLAAKRAEAKGGPLGFGLRPAREAALIRRLLAQPRAAASDALVVRVWRELIGDSLARQGPFRLALWGGRTPGRTAELARLRFGSAPPLLTAEKAEDALKAARTSGTVAVLALEPGIAWWGRLLAEPELSIFAVLPCLAAWGAPAALAVAMTRPEPSGADLTLFVTDAGGPLGPVEEALGAAGLVGDLLADAGGLKLFALAGFIQADDLRLQQAPGGLKGVVGAAAAPFDL